MLRKNQQGFGHLWLFVLIVFIIGSVGFVGWRVYRNQHQHGRPVINNYVAHQQEGHITNTGQKGNASGYLEPQDLAGCNGNAVLTSPLADPGTYTSITPLGNTSSYNGNVGHVQPVNHLYLNHSGPPTTANGSPIEPIPLTAPGNIEIFQVTATDHINTAGVDQLNDNKLYFATCKDVIFWVDHVTGLNPGITQALTSAAQQSCQSIVMDNLTYKSCTYNTNIKLSAGTLMGKGGADFGAVDYRTKPQAFLRPSAQQYLNTACGLDYFAEPYKTQMYNKLNTTRTGANGLPSCGTDLWDKSGTIQGDWYLPSAPTSGGGIDPYTLAITPLNTDPSQGNIDWGGTIAPADRIDYKTTTGGFINRDPATITADGHIYCFDDLSHGYAYARSVSVQLSDANTLKIQYHTGACPANPTLTAPTTYIR